MTVKTSVRMPDSLHARVKRQSKEKGRSINAIVLLALESHLGAGEPNVTINGTCSCDSEELIERIVLRVLSEAGV